MRRRRRRMDPASLTGSLLVHGAVLAVIVASSFREPPEFDFPTYEIELVSVAPPEQAEEPAPARDELVVERPEPTPPPPVEEPPPPEPEQTPEPEPEPEPPPPEPEPRREEPPPPEPEERRTPARDPEAETEPARETGENINVRMEGLRRDYPAYYENIILQMHRCFRWDGRDDLSVEIYFVIRRDGSVVDQRVLRSSGSAAFDIAALGAAECAGRGRFGELPADLPYDRFPVRFRFDPRGRDLA